MTNPPLEVFEWIGKAVQQHVNECKAEWRAYMSDCRADQAETKNQTLLLIQSIHEKMATVKDGAPGRDGRDGIDGKDGSDGLHGKDGRDGIDGKDGADGLNGKDGIDGKDGAPGEKGEKGDPGEKGETGEKGDPGIISAEALAEAYKGVWSEGEYDRGQVVTWGGSLWLSLAKNADKPGEQNDNWKLIVKRGRDGKNGDTVKGEKGDKGDKGDPGPRGYDA